MKLTRENIYVPLEGKSEEELTELYNFLGSIGEKQYDSLESFIKEDYYRFYNFDEDNEWSLVSEPCEYLENKQEVTIQQLKEILQPMEKFTPIAMKCTKKQFDAIKPKLQSLDTEGAYNFESYNYLLNFYHSKKNKIGNVSKSAVTSEVKIHEEWNEEIFLKACGIEVDTLEQQLEKAEAEVKRLKEAIEEEKIKIGDWVISELNNCVFKYQYGRLEYDLIKITDQELINKLNELIK